MTYRDAEYAPPVEGDPRWCTGVLCDWTGPISEAGIKDGGGPVSFHYPETP